MKSIVFMLFFATISMFESNNTVSYVNVFDSPQIVEFGITLNTSQCNNKAYLAVDLPKNTKGWIYSITPIDNDGATQLRGNLLDEVTRLAQIHQASKIPDFLSPSRSNKIFNLYRIQGKSNIQSFNNCGYFEYTSKFINTKARSGYVEKSSTDDTAYIGIENSHDLKKLRLKIEVVAVVNE